MGTELSVILPHSLDLPQIENLPASLNEYFRQQAAHIRVRRNHGYTGELVEGDSDDWVWKADVDPDWGDELGSLEGQHFWAWDWKQEKDGPFEQWFRTYLDNAFLRRDNAFLQLTGPYGFHMYVGSSALLLGTSISWIHFLFDDVVQGDVRRFCSILSGFLGGSSVIYVSDNRPVDCSLDEDFYIGRTYSQMLFRLSTTWELPRASIRDMMQTKYSVYQRDDKVWEARGYYVDDFTDIGDG